MNKMERFLQKLNKKYFDNCLPVLTIKYNDKKTKVIQGYLHYDNKLKNQPVIEIYTCWNKDREILIHETVHLWQLIKAGKTRHNQEFYDMEFKIVRGEKSDNKQHRTNTQ
jgi:hypothetical protein